MLKIIAGKCFSLLLGKAPDPPPAHDYQNQIFLKCRTDYVSFLLMFLKQSAVPLGYSLNLLDLHLEAVSYGKTSKGYGTRYTWPHIVVISDVAFLIFCFLVCVMEWQT